MFLDRRIEQLRLSRNWCALLAAISLFVAVKPVPAITFVLNHVAGDTNPQDPQGRR